MDSRYVFDLGTIDLSEGQSALARLAGDHDPLSLETTIWTQECAGPMGFPAWTVLDLRGAIRWATCDPSVTVTESSLRVAS